MMPSATAASPTIVNAQRKILQAKKKAVPSMIGHPSSQTIGNGGSDFRAGSLHLGACGNELQKSSNAKLLGKVVRWVVDAVVDDNVLEIERAQPRQASNVHAVLVRIRSSLMVGIDTAFRAKEMLCRTRIELVDGQRFGAAENINAAEIG